MKSESAKLSPVHFIGHGSPMNLISDNVYTRIHSKLGESLPPGSCVLVISAHWVTRGTFVTAQEHPRQIYDFGGFPKELYEIHYRPLGSVSTAESICKLNPEIKLDSSWGIDHGAWSILHHMLPQANHPVLQLSLNANFSPQQHLKMAQSLKALRKMNVVILGSGNLVHNLAKISWEEKAPEMDWALEFEDEIIQIVTSQNFSQEEKIEKIFSSPSLHLAHPTTEHLLPLIYAIGLANSDEEIKILCQGLQNGSISMAALGLGLS